MKPKDKVRKPNDRVGAVLTIHDRARMSAEVWNGLYDWLCRETRKLLDQDDASPKLYRARYLVAQKGRKK